MGSNLQYEGASSFVQQRMDRREVRAESESADAKQLIASKYQAGGIRPGTGTLRDKRRNMTIRKCEPVILVFFCLFVFSAALLKSLFVSYPRRCGCVAQCNR